MGFYNESASVVVHHAVIEYEIGTVSTDVVDNDFIIHRIICFFGLYSLNCREVEGIRFNLDRVDGGVPTHMLVFALIVVVCLVEKALVLDLFGIGKNRCVAKDLSA